jgi:hypothetical protein
MNLMRLCRQKAEEHGLDLEQLVWATVAAMFAKAASGDAPAAKLILDRFCGPVEKGIEIAVDARQVNLGEGPPLPKTKTDADNYVVALRDLAQQRGMFDNLPDSPTITLEHNQDELDDLLA